MDTSSRKQYNIAILSELVKLVEKYPDQRFAQIIMNYVLPNWRKHDVFYEESRATYENLAKLMEQKENGSK